MSNPYLDRLHGRTQESQDPSQPSKLSKTRFEGFEGGQGCHSSEGERPESSKKTPSTRPQSLQNLRSPSEPATALPEPSGFGCKVTIVEIPAIGLRYRRTFAHLQLKPPAYVPEDRWRQCIEDGRSFLHQWGRQAESLGWRSADLFGLHTPPADPHPSYRRLSRYDCTGLCWLLHGRPVVALTSDTAAIEGPSGNITVFRKNNRPVYGPLGDSLDDFK
jgi:hypothetical protein